MLTFQLRHAYLTFITYFNRPTHVGLYRSRWCCFPSPHHHSLRHSHLKKVRKTVCYRTSFKPIGGSKGGLETRARLGLISFSFYRVWENCQTIGWLPHL